MINKLNNFLYKQNEPLYTNENIEKIKNYIKSGKLPNDLNDIQLKRFIERFKYGYTLKNNKVFYKHLELISNEDMNDKLKEIYDDPNIGLGLGIVSFYKIVKDKYIGIIRDDVEKFLKNQTVYQITKEPRKGINKPIITTYPNERWAMDLIDMELYEKENNGYQQILTVIDYFSKFVWAEALKNRTSETIKNAMIKITNESNTMPKTFQADNGSEFKGEFSDWTHSNKIDLIKTLSYSPTSNGLIENYNKQLRKMIREGTIRYNSLNWVNHLNEYTNNHNNHKNTTTKYAPVEIWKEGNDKIDSSNYIVKENIEYYNVDGKIFKNDNNEITNDPNLKILRASERIKKVAKRNLDRTIVEQFNNGDMVRVLMSSLYSKIRAKLKEGKGKLLISKYSPDVYKVVEAPEPKGEHKEFMKPRYMLLDKDDKFIRTELKLNDPNDKRSAKLFFGSELLRIGENINDNMINKEFNNDDAFLINNGNFEEFKKTQKQKTKTKPKKQIDIIDEPINEIIEPIKEIIKPIKPIKETIEPRRSGRAITKNKNIFNNDFVN